MKGRGAAVGVALALTGCVYYNAIYNAERLFDQAERHHRLGRDSLAAAGFREVIDKSARGYRQEPEGEWADDALFLLGRAHLRLGEFRAARVALDEAAARAPTEEHRRAIDVYRAAVRIHAGERDAPLALLNRSLRELRPGVAMAEGHYWRARILLDLGREDAAWWDLDRAAAVHDALAVPAALERAAAGIRHDRPERAAEGVARLLHHRDGGGVADSLSVLLAQAAARWGPERAATLLADAPSAAWSPAERGRVLLDRAGLFQAAGDTAAARTDARAVAGGVGATSARARLLLARWLLADAQDLIAARDVLPVLLPAEGTPEAQPTLAALRALSDLAELGLDDPLGWFAAAEVARDRLDAPILARGLFLAFADAAPESPWSAKALLAALDVSPAEGDRAWLRQRLEGRSRSPYVLAARGEPAPGFEALEEELATRLEEIRSR
ncbi:MAG: hypothetical protein RH859_02980 [Longimicrobiales bacterium]